MATSTANVTKNPAAAESAPRKCGLMCVFKYLCLGLIAVVAILAIVIQVRPDEFKVSRSAMMKATPAAVFEQVNDFHKWDAWSPWVKLDPNAKSTFEGPTSGKDAKFHWAGNSDVGEGNMTIVESRPNDLVRLQLEFIKPFAGTNDVNMIIEPKGDETKLTWSLAGKTNFMTKAIGLVMDCDKMVGNQFEKGLATMKTIVEAQPAKPSGS